MFVKTSHGLAAALLTALFLSGCSSQDNEPDLKSVVDEQPVATPAPETDTDNPPAQEQETEVELKQQAETKLAELQQLMAQAQEQNLDTLREESIVWFANEFLKFADWDEANPDEIEKFFFHFLPYRDLAGTYAAELPEFERQQVVNILTTGIEKLTQVVNGEVQRPPVNKIDWENLEVQEDQLVSGGRPVFLYDYFSKSMGNPTSDERVYNDHLGNVDQFPSVNPFWLNREDNIAPWQRDRATAHESTKAGYSLLWNSVLPAWMAEQDPNIAQGRSLFTGFDIDNPLMIDSWRTIIREATAINKDHKAIQLGIILSNEPHWYSEQGHWTQNYGEMTSISIHTLNKFKTWLSNKYLNVSQLNQNWQTQFDSFADVSFEIPINPALRGQPIWYDWCRFNMDRATEWFTFLQNEILDVNPDADTNIKIMPDVFTENNRSHGIDLEALTSLTTMIGDDAKTRGRDLRSTGPEHWEAYYSYFWEELAVSYDFMESVSPNKIHVNSEAHFLSTSWWRDLETTPEYVRSSFWLATVLGMDVGLSWFWARDPDGSPEQRLEGELDFFDPALAGSFAASAGMQPQVANEVTQVMMDLNSVSEAIIAVRKQRRPVRMFYSETSAINKTHHMTEQFELFEELFFTGIPVGYVTQKVIENQDTSLWDVVLVYKTEYVTDAEFTALQGYLDAGGTVVLDNNTSLAKNEYGQTRAQQLSAGNGQLITLGSSSTAAELKNRGLTLIVDGSDQIAVTEDNGLSRPTTMWRSAKQSDGSYFVSLSNLGKNETQLTLSLPQGEIESVTDLLTGHLLETEFSLASNGVRILKVIPKS